MDCEYCYICNIKITDDEYSEDCNFVVVIYVKNVMMQFHHILTLCMVMFVKCVMYYQRSIRLAIKNK